MNAEAMQSHFIPSAVRDVLIGIMVLCTGFIGAHVLDTSRAIDRLDERTVWLQGTVVRLENQARECTHVNDEHEEHE